MFSLHRLVIAAPFLLSHLSSVSAQWNFPSCVNQCIDQSTDDSCSLFDVKCICRQSNGKFLPDLVLCMHTECDRGININVLLTPLEFICRMAGTPVSEWALENAQSFDSSIAAEATTTVFSYAPAPSMTTITVTSKKDGSTFAVAYPVTVYEHSQATGSPSTVSTYTSDEESDDEATTSSRPSLGWLIPVTLTTTLNDGGLTSTRTDTESRSTYTSANPEGNTVTVVTTYTLSTSPADAQTTDAPVESAISSTTTVAEATTTRRKSSDGGGSPFSPQEGDGLALRANIMLCLGLLTVVMMVLC